MALALYRKYRPATFAEVVGQEHVTGPLSTALAAGRVNHAYLFSGPRGCGKTSSARILARSLNCEQGPTAEPCGQCPSCQALAPEGPGSIDVVELDAASHGGVDDARDLRDRAFYAPAQSRYRVFVIDEAHMVTTQGFNALLKIVEEPPEHLVFVFATTEPDKVLPTIRSRTHHYPFRLLPPATLRGLLEGICADEGVLVEPSVFPLVVRAGGGSARDALSVLDQLLAGAGQDGVTYRSALPLLGVSDVTLIDDVVDALAVGDGAAVFTAVDRLIDAGHDARRFAADLLARFRDLTLLQAVPDAATRGMIDAPADELTRMTAQTDRLTPAALARHAEIVHNGLVEMRGATSPRLLLELLCGRMLVPAASADSSALLHRLELVERRLAIAPAQPADQPPATPPPAERRQPARPTRQASQTPQTERPQPARQPEPPRPAEPPAAPQRPAEQPAPGPATQATPPAQPAQPSDGGDQAAAVRRSWPDLLARVSKRSRVTYALLNGASVQTIDGDTLVLSVSTSALAKRLSEQRHLDQIAEALREAFGVSWRVRCQHGDDAGTAARPEPARRATQPAAAARSDQPAARRQPRPPERRTPERAAEHRPAGPATRSRGGQPADDIPLPPEPPPDPGPDQDGELDEATMLAESAVVANGTGEGKQKDQEEVAFELLASQLGARKIDE